MHVPFAFLLGLSKPFPGFPRYQMTKTITKLFNSTYHFLNVVNEEGAGPDVVDGAVEEAETLLGVEIDGDDVVEAALDQHLGDQLQVDVAAATHLGCLF